ncbi:hypothetical protein X777_04155 [Ooceraea biroi]|uniref:Uncharacterized protein n=1 Tax=Ooceraea biroi TaxID=2015173 RepID=A0A026WJ94_OOCBI|nr:hypothetical protein X777_04155 [Ooceraea biroi]
MKLVNTESAIITILVGKTRCITFCITKVIGEKGRLQKCFLLKHIRIRLKIQRDTDSFPVVYESMFVVRVSRPVFLTRDVSLRDSSIKLTIGALDKDPNWGRNVVRSFHQYQVASVSRLFISVSFSLILFTDEASFTNYGHVNVHYMHYWSIDNPHWVREVEYQRWSVNVWCGIIGDKIIGPYFINGTLNSIKYDDFIRNNLGILLEDV